MKSFLILTTLLVIPFVNSQSIIGGSPAYQGKFPYHADVGISENGVSTWCSGGGVLVSLQWVLTSSSCLYGIWSGQKKVIIILGSTTRDEQPETLKFEISPNSTNIIFNTASPDAKDDLVLIQLPKQTSFTTNVQQVSLPRTKGIYGILFNERAYVTGWKNESTTNSSLTFFEINTIKNTNCVEEYDPERRDIIAPKNICAKLEMDTAQECFGGVGAPLVSLPYNILIGITSTLSLKNCDRPGSPVVFLRITDYLDWIKATAFA
ncbi:hypothetical protein ACFFRR_010239 [Megaselia abdita]